MSNNIIIRKARNNYVCECCGHIIKAGSEYLDKVILNNGKCVEHTRYHDECPKVNPQEYLFNKIVQSNGDLIVADKQGIKIRIAGLAFANDDWYVLYHDWNDPKGKYMLFTNMVDYHDANGDPVI